MSISDLLSNKPVLIGLHLVFAILGIDLFLWLAGEVIANPVGRLRMRLVAVFGVISFILTWIVGGYYYVVYYGSLVKPIIKAGVAPWAHVIAMEAKEHLFLFIIPLALTAVFLSFLKKEQIESFGLKRTFLSLTVLVAFLGLFLGLLGYIISAAARWA